MITFEEAQASVGAIAGGYYTPEQEFVIPPWGWENDDVYVVIAGPRLCVYGPSSLAEAQAATLIADNGPSWLVDKVTGEVSETYPLPGEDPAPNLTPVGDVPYDGDV